MDGFLGNLTLYWGALEIQTNLESWAGYRKIVLLEEGCPQIDWNTTVGDVEAFIPTYAGYANVTTEGNILAPVQDEYVGWKIQIVNATFQGADSGPGPNVTQWAILGITDPAASINAWGNLSMPRNMGEGSNLTINANISIRNPPWPLP